MAKLLPTSLPLAQNEVTGEIFNRLVRIIELNLGQLTQIEHRNSMKQKLRN